MRIDLNGWDLSGHGYTGLQALVSSRLVSSLSPRQNSIDLFSFFLQTTGPFGSFSTYNANVGLSSTVAMRMVLHLDRSFALYASFLLHPRTLPVPLEFAQSKSVPIPSH